MSDRGYVFRDGGLIPDEDLPKEQASTVQAPGTVRENPPSISETSGSPIHTPSSSLSTIVSNPPTDSHALAGANHEEKGAAQLEHYEAEVKDLGWEEHPDNIPKPLVGGLPNDELWLLVRRFNKVKLSWNFPGQHLQIT